MFTAAAAATAALLSLAGLYRCCRSGYNTVLGNFASGFTHINLFLTMIVKVPIWQEMCSEKPSYHTQGHYIWGSILLN